MRPNLKEYNALVMQFASTCTLSSDIVNSLHTISTPDKDGDFYCEDLYENHIGNLWVIHKEKRKKTNIFDINCYYRLSRHKKHSVGSEKISELLNILAKLSEPNKFQCQVSFATKKSNSTRQLIYLPIKLGEMSTLPFNIIQGLHLIKTISAEKEYDIYIEGSDKNTLYTNLVFSVDSLFSTNLANSILVEAHNIAKAFW